MQASYSLGLFVSNFFVSNSYWWRILKYHNRREVLGWYDRVVLVLFFGGCIDPPNPPILLGPRSMTSYNFSDTDGKMYTPRSNSYDLKKCLANVFGWRYHGGRRRFIG